MGELTAALALNPALRDLGSSGAYPVVAVATAAATVGAAILAELARGRRAQAVADHYVVSLATVRTQIRSVLSKLEVGSQLEAVALYRRGRSG